MATRAVQPVSSVSGVRAAQAFGTRALADRRTYPERVVRVAADGTADARSIRDAMAIAHARAERDIRVERIVVAPDDYEGGFTMDLPLSIEGDPGDVPFIGTTPDDPVVITAPTGLVTHLGFFDLGYEEAARVRADAAPEDWDANIRPIVEVVAGAVVLEDLGFAEVVDGALLVSGPDARPVLRDIAEYIDTRFDLFITDGASALLEDVVVDGVVVSCAGTTVTLRGCDLQGLWAQSGSSVTASDTRIGWSMLFDRMGIAFPTEWRGLVFTSGQGTLLRMERVEVERRWGAESALQVVDGGRAMLSGCRLLTTVHAFPREGWMIGLVYAEGEGSAVELRDCALRFDGDPGDTAMIHVQDGASVVMDGTRADGQAALVNTGSRLVVRDSGEHGMTWRRMSAGTVRVDPPVPRASDEPGDA